MIFDVYGENCGSRFFASPALGGMFFSYRLPEFVFDCLPIVSINQLNGQVGTLRLDRRSPGLDGRSLFFRKYTLATGGVRMFSGTRRFTGRNCWRNYQKYRLR
jgi:hypothetical protein